MAEVTNSTPTYDYSSIGSFGSDATQSVNGELINKIRASEEKSLIDPITEDIENIGLEKEKIAELQTKVTSFQDIVNYFDIYNDENVFNQYLFDTSGTSAVYDAVNMSSLEEGTTNIDITQLAQKDVFQSNQLTGISKTDQISFGGGVAIGDKLTITVGNNTPYEFTMYNLNDAGDAIDTVKTYEELAIEINQKEDLQASLEAVATDGSGDPIYRLVIKSSETGEDNALTISQSGNVDFGFGATSSSTISDWGDFLGAGSLTINGEPVIADTDGLTYQDLFDDINAYALANGSNFSAVKNTDNNRIEIVTNDGSAVTVVESGSNNLNFSDLSQVQEAQNLIATIDEVSYNSSSNSITTQGSLKITAIEEGKSSVTISHDTSAVTVAAEAMATQYNDLMTFINDELYSPDSVIEDKDSLRTIQNDIKNMLLSNYGADTIEWTNVDDDGNADPAEHSNVANNDKNIFVMGFSLDKSGELIVDTTTINNIISGEDDNYDFDDLKSVFTGVYENKGLGVQLKEYLDDLDGYEGLLTTYETNMTTRLSDLEEEKEEELERLDNKYGIMAQQFAEYSAVIAQFEAAFSGLKMMIEQSTASN